ncbi:polysaccharide pyruvyl transferase family protein [Eubacteriaceae bacterium ES2]|nr:polysaccharide pyruvyl transferase family protein [Eubacteriaceae bacterium ES2]
MKKKLKNVIPERLLLIIRMKSDILKFSQLMKSIENQTETHSFIFGTPIHTNLGDHLITLSERCYLNKIGYPHKIIEVPTEMFKFYRNRLKNAIPSDATVFINGGGWMGNLWPEEEKIIHNILLTFCKNKIIIFPQTIFYDNQVLFYDELIGGFKMASTKCENLTVFVRDRQSYEFAKKKFRDVTIQLIPDIALLYYNYASWKSYDERNNEVGICLRGDREKYRDIQVEESVLNTIEKIGYRLVSIDTISKRRISSCKREEAVEKKLSEFSEKKLIVTDRLHGMIFAYLTRTPCIVFDNLTKKVSGVYFEWLYECEYILPLFGEYEESKLNSFIAIISDQKQSFEYCIDEKFDFLKEVIING